MKQLLPVIASLLFLSCGNDQYSSKKSSEKQGLDTTAGIYNVTASDTSMNAAISKARKTIGEFDEALLKNNPSFSDFAVKKKYRTPDDGGEHMWIAGISLVNGEYHGYINNDAESTTEVKYGDKVIVQKNEITDWMYLDNNVLKGGYTIREIRNRLTKKEQIKMDQELGFIVEE